MKEQDDEPSLARIPETRTTREQWHDLANEILKWGGAMVAGLLVTQTFRILDQTAINAHEIAEIQALQAATKARLDGIDNPGGRLDRIQYLLQQHMTHEK